MGKAIERRGKVTSVLAVCGLVLIVASAGAARADEGYVYTPMVGIDPAYSSLVDEYGVERDCCLRTIFVIAKLRDLAADPAVAPRDAGTLLKAVTCLENAMAGHHWEEPLDPDNNAEKVFGGIATAVKLLVSLVGRVPLAGYWAIDLTDTARMIGDHSLWHARAWIPPADAHLLADSEAYFARGDVYFAAALGDGLSSLGRAIGDYKSTWQYALCAVNAGNRNAHR